MSPDAFKLEYPFVHRFQKFLRKVPAIIQSHSDLGPDLKGLIATTSNVYEGMNAVGMFRRSEHGGQETESASSAIF